MSLVHDERIIELVARIPALAGAKNICALEGGLTNKNYRIDTETNSYVMRVSAADSGLLGINRDNERINTGYAYQAGVGPRVVDAIPEERVLLLEWIEAVPLHASTIQTNPSLIGRMAKSIRTLHAGPEFQGVFHFPEIRAKYLKTVVANGYFLPEGYLELEPRIAALEALLDAVPEKRVPCNNDLLAGNFLDDGDKIWIIDYEYAGQNEASFELGNLASESGFSEQALALLCDAYWQEKLPSKMVRAKAWSMIARFGWVLWASIQESVSSLPFDFRNWGLRKWNSVLPEISGAPYQEVAEQLKQFMA